MPKSAYYPEDEEMDGPQESPPVVETPESEDAEGETFLVNASALGTDIKPGDECTIKIVALHDDEAECEYVKSDKEETPAAPEKSFPETIGDRLRGKPGLG